MVSISLGINSAWASGMEGAASLHDTSLISWKLLKGGKFYCPWVNKRSPETELDLWTEVSGCVPAYSRLSEFELAYESFLPGSQSSVSKCFNFIPECSEKTAEEKGVIKSSLCFPVHWSFHRCLLLGLHSSHSAANTEAGFFSKGHKSPVVKVTLVNTHFLQSLCKRWQTPQK